MRTFQGAAEDVRLEGPPEGVQLAAGAVGVLASAVVAWSECVLRVTGCGLPPGPGGALGALEGVSYLAVGAVFLWSLVTKARTGSGLPAGPGGLLGAAEGTAFLVVLGGFTLLILQTQTYGYIPGFFPDANCFG